MIITKTDVKSPEQVFGSCVRHYFFSYCALTSDTDDMGVVLFRRVCDVFQVLRVPAGLSRFLTRADPASVAADECSDGEHHFTQRAKKRVTQPEGSRGAEMSVNL